MRPTRKGLSLRGQETGLQNNREKAERRDSSKPTQRCGRDTDPLIGEMQKADEGDGDAQVFREVFGKPRGQRAHHVLKGVRALHHATPRPLQHRLVALHLPQEHTHCNFFQFKPDIRECTASQVPPRPSTETTPDKCKEMTAERRDAPARRACRSRRPGLARALEARPGCSSSAL